MISKIVHYGLDGQQLGAYIAGWNETQRQHINGCLLKWEASTKLPQGLILDSVPFNIVVNDLESEEILIRFLDDTKLDEKLIE